MVAATFWVIILDISLGYIRGWARKEFSSTISKEGLGSHAFIFVTVAISYPLAVLANVTTEADMFIYYLFFSYAASILKNGEAIGIKIPFITKYVSDRVDSHKNEDEVKKEKNND
jgi:toxin secretion/phage lysis holin